MSAPGPKGRKTVYKGIQMRSRLEAGFAAWLDKSHLEWSYEPHAFANESGQYLPDFLIDGINYGGTGPARVWVEIKPEGFTDFPRVAAGFDIVAESDTGAIFVLQVAGQVPLQYVGGDNPWLPAVWTVIGGADFPTACPRCKPDDFELQCEVRKNAPTHRIGLSLPAYGRLAPWHGDYWSAGEREAS